MRGHILPVLLLAAGCGEAVEDDHFARPLGGNETAAAEVKVDEVPVRVGELGPSFAACGAAGTTRNLAAGETLAVSAAPFDNATETGKVPAGSRFFVCSRSHDQRWLGIVYEPGGTLGQACGVSAPLPSRRDYEGPCRSGWVSAAFVKLVAG